jgi:hypothetical protein
MKPVTRQKLNIIIDIIMFVVMVLLAVIGFIIRYIIIPGSERWERYGRNVDLTIWGMDRHEWGFIHMILGILLVVMLILHIIFHWQLIICLFRRLIPGKNFRYAIVTLLVIVSALFMAAPFYLNTETGDPIRRQGEGYGRMSNGRDRDIEIQMLPKSDEAGTQVESYTDNSTGLKEVTDITESAAEDQAGHYAGEDHEGEHVRVLDIKGYHTIGYLAATHNISAGELKKKLDIPLSVSDNERLGRIRRIYGFTMSEVEDCILDLRETGVR